MQSDRPDQFRILDRSFGEHLTTAFKHRGKPFKSIPNYETEIQHLMTRGEVIDFLSSIDSGTIAFDYETNMLKPDSKKAKIVSCSVCYNGKETVAFPMLPGVEKELRRVLSNRRIRKLAQNMKYEDRWSRDVLGVQVRGWWWDSMLAAHILDCRHGVSGLKFLAFVMLGMPKYDEHIEPYLKAERGNDLNRIHEIPLPSLLTYNGLDSLLQYKITMIQTKQMKIGENNGQQEANR
jgi:hypothetical protein